jgi:D-alanyl-lipoteichoic acid acyltransferase DltB (MBOAT superfamily)
VRLYASVGIGLNLAGLAAFKYAGFFAEAAAEIVRALGGHSGIGTLQVILPVGISFYSFQGIAYIVEVYRDRTKAGGLLDTAFVLTFFPKLLAGPLVRASDLRSQLYRSDTTPSGRGLRLAAGLLLVGLFKKIVIADGLGSLADAAFRAAQIPGAAASFPTPLFWQGFYLYAIQIYADFSGYTDLARGSAALLGFDLPLNFRRPYFAVGLGDFWNRWHMSLTQWFREHLFNPLTRVTLQNGRLPRNVAQVGVTLVTMAAIGLWHGASWMFVAWGVWHGALLSIERLSRVSPRSAWGRVVASLVTFHVVGLGWILFRSSSMAAAGQFALGLFTFRQLHWAGFYLAPVLWAGILVVGLDVGEMAERRMSPEARVWWRSIAAIAGGLVVAVLLLLAWARGSQALPFIYGQF